MRLYVTGLSPYARKTWAAVLELGLQDQVAITQLPARMPTVAKPELEVVNPLAKVPALVTNQGDLLVDSPVILAFLDSLGGDKLIPSGPERWRVLTLEALADGCMDAGVVLRVESLKEESRRDPDEIAAHQAKIGRTLDLIESDARWLAGDLNAGTLAIVCALDWLVFRALLPDPLNGRPRIAAFLDSVQDRPALAATRPAQS